MSTTTQCPQCNTRFKVSQEQLDAHQGLVRCGRCQAVFNAAEHLQDDQPSPQLDLPIGPEETRQTPAEAVHEELDFSRMNTVLIKTPGGESRPPNRPRWRNKSPLQMA